MKTNEIIIEHNIPIPEKAVYPFNKMEVTDSFLITVEDKTQTSKLAITISSAMAAYCNQHKSKGFKFARRMAKNKRSIRVWRIK